MNADAERLAELLDAWQADDALTPPADELAELVAAAAQVRLLADVPPPPTGLNRGRAAFIAAGVAQAQRPAATTLRAAVLGLFGRYHLAPLAMMVAVLFLGGVVTTARAQSSLPGDLLYPVKRLTESVRVVITSADDRETVRAELQLRRREEAQQLLARHRAQPVAFEGAAVLGADGRWTVGGVVVAFGAGIPEGLAPGAVVSVMGMTDPDGVVRVSELQVLVPVAASPTPAVAELPATPVVAIIAPVDEPTPTSGPPTATVAPILPTRVLPPTMPPPTALPTDLPTPLAPDAPKLREKQIVEWDGNIQKIGEDTWIVGGQEFYRRGFTAVGATMCAYVHVKAERKRDGRLELISLTVLSPAPKPEPVSFDGRITALGDDFIEIDRHRIVRPSNMVVVGELAIGTHVRFNGRRECGWMIAERVEVQGLRQVQFTGTLEAFAADAWVIDGRTVQLTGATKVEGTPWVGARVDVTAEEAGDGVLRALRLVVRDAPPTATTEPAPATPTLAAADPLPSTTPGGVATAEPTATAGEP